MESIGSYRIDGVKDPLYNTSQIACSTPFDDAPPCPPTLIASNLCDEDIPCEDEGVLENNLIWHHPRENCERAADVNDYNLYYASSEDGVFNLIASINEADLFAFDHQPANGLAGCYAITAIDTNNNESEFINIVCVENCLFYNLPSTFTPNGDNQNDLFTPYPYCFIESVNF